MVGRKHRIGHDRGREHFRAERGLWLYGDHAVAAALANPRRVFRRLLCVAQPPPALPKGVAAERIDRAGLDSILPRGAVHQGIALLVDPLPVVGLEALAAAPAGRPAVAIMLDQVTDPQNVGAVLRSAAAFGAVGVVVQDRHAPEESAALAKAASGALETVPMMREPNLSRALDELKEAGYWAIGLDQEAATSLEESAGQERVVLVLGAEGTGIRRLVREHCDLLASIPMVSGTKRGAVTSLNVSNAAAIALYILAKPPRVRDP